MKKKRLKIAVFGWENREMKRERWQYINRRKMGRFIGGEMGLYKEKDGEEEKEG